MKIPKTRKMKILSQEQNKLHVVSTQTSETWMQDPQNEISLCLLKDDARQP